MTKLLTKFTTKSKIWKWLTKAYKWRANDLKHARPNNNYLILNYLLMFKDELVF